MNFPTKESCFIDAFAMACRSSYKQVFGLRKEEFDLKLTDNEKLIILKEFLPTLISHTSFASTFKYYWRLTERYDIDGVLLFSDCYPFRKIAKNDQWQKKLIELLIKR